MHRTMMKSKIHRATVTGADVDYVGSITLDPELMRLADYLRIALECTDERGMTPERERLLEAAVAALRDSGAYPIDLTLSA